jgi:signal transduction histidine kinase/DNA-binding response OmpR family regulator
MPEGDPLPQEERRRVLSIARLSLSFLAFIVVIVVGLTALQSFGVARIFDWLTPSMRRDLEWKTQRGAVELAQTAQLGMLIKDPAAIRAAASDYLGDRDIVKLVVVDPAGNVLFEHGSARVDLARLFKTRRATAHDQDQTYAAWADSQLEGVEAGRVALFVSKARLEAGLELRGRMLSTAAISCAVALALGLLYVALYLRPILRVTAHAFHRLERTTEAALAATRLKSEFLANMSHEIRTPMNGIIGVLDLLNRTVLNSKQQRYTQTIDASARSLLTIIDDILDFSKLEAGKFAVRSDDLDVRQMLQEVAELLAPRAHAKDIELVHRVASDVPVAIRGDVDRVKQVLTNLVGNGIKFTEAGHVEVRVTAEAGERGPNLRFSVADTGVGIKKEDQAKLFGVFSQVDGSLTRKYGGTGLGLAISKRLVEAMGGEIGLSSEPGHGCTFWFTLPAKPSTLTRAEAEVVPRDCRVLVIGKDEAQRNLICDLVTAWGMTFAVTDTASHALALVMEADPRPFDVAVIDGSFEASDSDAEMLFDLCATEDLPVARLLATTQTAEASEAGSRQLFLTKPVRVSELYNGLISLVDRLPLARRARSSDPVQPPREAESSTGRATVLVVDDNEINRLVAGELLRDFGYASDTACDGAEAIAKVERTTYAAILMDCQMPGMDGLEATRRIRAMPAPKGTTPIIALTAHALAGDRERVLEAGMDDYTPKPVRARALEKLLERWVRTSDSSPAGPESERAGAAVSHPAPAAPVPPEPLSDAALAALELDPSVRRSPRLIELFIAQSPPLIEAICAAAEAGKLEDVRTLAHKLKGSCLSLGVMWMAHASSEIEQAASQGRIDVATVGRLPAMMVAARDRLGTLHAVPVASKDGT